jgi:hypothetical protein
MSGDVTGAVGRWSRELFCKSAGQVQLMSIPEHGDGHQLPDKSYVRISPRKLALADFESQALPR